MLAGVCGGLYVCGNAEFTRQLTRRKRHQRATKKTNWGTAEPRQADIPLLPGGSAPADPFFILSRFFYFPCCRPTPLGDRRFSHTARSRPVSRGCRTEPIAEGRPRQARPDTPGTPPAAAEPRPRRSAGGEGRRRRPRRRPGRWAGRGRGARPPARPPPRLYLAAARITRSPRRRHGRRQHGAPAAAEAAAAAGAGSLPGALPDRLPAQVPPRGGERGAAARPPLGAPGRAVSPPPRRSPLPSAGAAPLPFRRRRRRRGRSCRRRGSARPPGPGRCSEASPADLPAGLVGPGRPVPSGAGTPGLCGARGPSRERRGGGGGARAGRGPGSQPGTACENRGIVGGSGLEGA